MGAKTGVNLLLITENRSRLLSLIRDNKRLPHN